MLSENQIKALQQVAEGRRSFGPEDTAVGESKLDVLKRVQPIAEEIIELGDGNYLEDVKPHHESSTAYSYIDRVMVRGITEKGRRSLEGRSSRNLLYHSRRTLGAHPSQVYAWHVTSGEFPNERALEVLGYPVTVSVTLLDPAAEGAGPDSRFVSGTIKITWERKENARALPSRNRQPRLRDSRPGTLVGASAFHGVREREFSNLS